MPAHQTGKYRSKLESRVGKKLEKFGWEYEPIIFGYTVERNYTPDFVQGNIYVEVKGFFRTGDIAKYLGILNSLEEDEELVFILSHPNKPIRKKAKLTMSGWCEKHGIRWFSEHDLSELQENSE